MRARRGRYNTADEDGETEFGIPYPEEEEYADDAVFGEDDE